MRLLSFSFIPFFFLLCACGSEADPKAPLPPVDVPAPPPMVENDDEPDVLLAWVDGASVRAKPSTSSERVARLSEGEEVTALGENSAASEEILLRGVVYDENWVKVKTKDGTEGWVYGGTVRRPDEEKGNIPITENSFAFPYFGRFDLEDWKQLPNIAESGGDATIVTQTFEKDGQELSIQRADVGEYGYTHVYTLRDVEGKELLRRELSYDGFERELTETVTNNIEAQPVVYTRSQKLGKSPYQLGGNALIVNGEWRKQ